MIQAIKIEKNITNIMHLPCVTRCTKLNDGVFMFTVRVRRVHETDAYIGDWLVEEHPGFWVVMEHEDYVKQYGRAEGL